MVVTKSSGMDSHAIVPTVEISVRITIKIG